MTPQLCPKPKINLKSVRYILLLFICFSSIAILSAQNATHSIKVMAWNILHGANDIPDGRENAIKIIEAINPDVLLMVETYGSGPAIADRLGYHFHLIAPKGTRPDDKNVNLSIFSRYPFGQRIDTDYPFYLGGREILIGDQKIRVFSNWFHYDPWSDAPEQLGKKTEELLTWERTGKKYEMIRKVLPTIQKFAQQADAIPLIIGGDMNTPSHLDWGEETKSTHQGLVVPWYATKVLEDCGLIDTYRKIHPNPNRHPGITWDSKGKKDEHRIDYIFYKGKDLDPVESRTYHAYFNEPMLLKGQEIMYPSDHGFVVTIFELRGKQME